MVKLDLPGFDYQISKAEGKIWIFDVIRKKQVVLTPEEWVRQHIIHFFINQLQYPKSLIKIESRLTYNQLQKRSDVVVYDREGKPWLLLECKAPELKLNQNAVMQAAVYNNDVKAKFIAISNGMQHVCYEVKENVSETKLLKKLPRIFINLRGPCAAISISRIVRGCRNKYGMRFINFKSPAIARLLNCHAY